MAGWRETIDPKEAKQTRENLTFTRRFVQSSFVGTCYPQMWTAHPDSSVCFVDAITIKPLNKSSLIDQATITYSPLNDETQQPAGTVFNDLPLTMGTGGEVFTQKTEGADYYWLNGDNSRAISEPQIRVPTGNMELTEIIASSAMAVSSSTGAFQRSIVMAGKINKATFQGLGYGNWLYSGGNFSRIRNSSGALQYRVVHSFAYRVPDLANHPNNGWRLLWNEPAQEWDLITDTPGGVLSNPIPYSSGDFGRIFTTSGVV